MKRNHRSKKRNQRAVDRVVSQFADSIAPYTGKHDVRPLLEFQRLEFGADARQSQPDFAHWVYPGPFGNRLNYCDIGGEIAGQQGELKTTLQVAGRQVPAAWAIDLRVRPAWRLKGLGVALVATLLKENAVVMALGISEEARKMFSRQGWVIYGRIDAFHKPVTPLGFHVTDEGHRGPGERAAKVLYHVCRLADMAAIRLRRHRGEVVELERFDADIEPVLAYRAAHSLVSCKRTVEFLNWRFVDCPFADRYRILACRGENGFAGIAVVSTSSRQGKKLAVIEELAGTPAAQSQLVDSIIKSSYEKDIDAVYYEGLDIDLAHMLRRKMFFERDGGHYFAVFSSDDTLDADLANRANWNIRLADSDAGFGGYDNDGDRGGHAGLVLNEGNAG